MFKSANFTFCFDSEGSSRVYNKEAWFKFINGTFDFSSAGHYSTLFQLFSLYQALEDTRDFIVGQTVIFCLF